MNKRTLIITAGLLALSLLHSVEVKKKEIRDFESFKKGRFAGTGLTDSGELFISLKGSVLPGPEKEYYLGGDISRGGDLYLGTGHDASLFKIGKDGKVTEMFKAQEPDIYAVLAGSDDQIYAASSPRGKLYRITGIMKSKEIFNPDEKYIWDIKEDKTGNIICAVGGSGGIYRIDKEGNSKQIFSGDTHILSLFISSDNSVLAGSGGNGILYRIRAQKSDVLYDTPYEEINGIVEDKEGGIWFTASKEVRKRGDSDGETVSPTYSKKNVTPEDKSALYFRHTGGEVEEIWSSPDELIYSIVQDTKNGGVLIGTGDSGRIYSVQKDRRYSLIYEGESAQTFKMLPGQDGYTILFNNTASIVKLSHFPSSQGSYISDIFNLGIQSRAGRIYWDSKNGNSPAVSLFVRTGNTASPDSTWTEWSPPFTDNNNSTIDRAGYKYIQVKVNLNASQEVKSPAISGFRFFYIQENLKPEIKKISISMPSQSGPDPEQKKPPLPKKNILNITWEAEDPNGDELNYSIYLKRTSGNGWIRFKEDLKETKAELDTTLYEDGDYTLKLAADDSLSNSPETFSTVTRISESFTIDSTAPVLTGFQASADALSFRVDDSSSVISTVYYSFTGEKWFPLYPVDKINDSRSENYILPRKFTKGEKLIFFKVTDEYKNSKVFQKEL